MRLTNDGIQLTGGSVWLGVLGLALVIAGIFYWSLFRDTRRQYPEQPGQREVIDVIWHHIFGVPRFSWFRWSTRRNRPPTVDWATGDRLDYEGRAFWYYYSPNLREPPQRIHVAGVASRDGKQVKVALPWGKKLSQTALVHELYHQRLALAKGDGDHEHTNAGWKDPGGPVAQADAEMARRGL